MAQIADQVERILTELAEAGNLRSGDIVVIGASTSEVAGRRIGTAGSLAPAAEIHEGVSRVLQRLGLEAVWQCCEHLNRALAAERALAERMGWTSCRRFPCPGPAGPWPHTRTGR